MSRELGSGGRLEDQKNIYGRDGGGGGLICQLWKSTVYRRSRGKWATKNRFRCKLDLLETLNHPCTF